MSAHDTTTASATPAADVADALDVIRLLAGEIGPRRPCSPAEARAGSELGRWLRERGIDSRLESFRGFASFGPPYAAMLGLSLAGGGLQSKKVPLGDLLAAAAFGALALEGDLRFTPVSNLFARKSSANLIATVAPFDEPRSRVCLCAHMDTTRSGLMFHPALQRALPILLAIPALSAATLAAGPIARRLGFGRGSRRAAIAGLVFALAMIAEREWRGEDVAGASDNASGCGVALRLLLECARTPLRHTEVDLLVTGCEESGVLGAQDYVRRHRDVALRTVFVNFDTVGGDVPLTYILREGATTTRPASPRLVALMERIAARSPELRLHAGRRTAGLPTDATVALAHGCEAITLLARGDTIPHYHWPSDTVENVWPATIRHALLAGRELLAELDREGD